MYLNITNKKMQTIKQNKNKTFANIFLIVFFMNLLSGKTYKIKFRFGHQSRNFICFKYRGRKIKLWLKHATYTKPEFVMNAFQDTVAIKLIKVDIVDIANLIPTR